MWEGQLTLWVQRSIHLYLVNWFFIVCNGVWFIVVVTLPTIPVSDVFIVLRGGLANELHIPTNVGFCVLWPCILAYTMAMQTSNCK